MKRVFQMRKLIVILSFLLVLITPSLTFAVLTKEDIEEIRKIVRDEIAGAIAPLEKRVAPLEKSIPALEKSVAVLGRSFEDFRREVDKKIDYLYMLLSAIIALNGVMVGAVIWLALPCKKNPLGAGIMK